MVRRSCRSLRSVRRRRMCTRVPVLPGFGCRAPRMLEAIRNSASQSTALLRPTSGSRAAKCARAWGAASNEPSHGGPPRPSLHPIAMEVVRRSLGGGRVNDPGGRGADGSRRSPNGAPAPGDMPIRSAERHGWGSARRGTHGGCSHPGVRMRADDGSDSRRDRKRGRGVREGSTVGAPRGPAEGRR